MSFQCSGKGTILGRQMSSLFSYNCLDTNNTLRCLCILKSRISDLPTVCITPVPLPSLHIIRIGRAEDIHELSMPWQHIVVNDWCWIRKLKITITLNSSVDPIWKLITCQNSLDCWAGVRPESRPRIPNIQGRLAPCPQDL